jgi:hypothetical protein
MTDNQQPQPGEAWGDPMDEATWAQVECIDDGVCPMPQFSRPGTVESVRFGVKSEDSHEIAEFVGAFKNITAIVRQHLADAEPITVERMEAMGAKHEFTNEDDIAEYELLGLDVMVLADGVVRVYGRDAILNPRTMGDLRAALRLLGGES